MHRSKSHAAALGGYVESLFCFVLFFGCCFGLRVPFAFLVFFLQNISLNLLYCGFRWQVWVLNIAWLLYVLQFRHSSFCVGVISFVIFHAFPVPSLHVPDVKRMFRNEKELYGVGFVDYEYEINNTNKKAALGRMFYPTAKKARSDPQEWNSYFFKADTAITRAFCGAFHFPSWLQFVIDHWTCIEAPMEWLPPVENSVPGEKREVVVFCHGLSGTRETNTSLAIALVRKRGCFVLCVEHTDASCSLARFHNGGTMEYNFEPEAIRKKGGDTAFKEARRAQTRTRVEDVERTLSFLQALDDGLFFKTLENEVVNCRFFGVSPFDMVKQLSMFKGKVDTSNIVLGGHSFGGATVLAAACQVEKFHVKALFSLDPACDWIPREVWHHFGKDGGDDVNPGGTLGIMNHFPLLTVFSSEWFEKDWNYNLMKGVSCGEQENHPNSCVCAIQGSKHMGFTEMLSFMPSWIGSVKAFRGFASRSKPTEVVDSTVQCILTFLSLSASKKESLNQRTKMERIGLVYAYEE